MPPASHRSPLLHVLILLCAGVAHLVEPVAIGKTLHHLCIHVIPSPLFRVGDGIVVRCHPNHPILIARLRVPPRLEIVRPPLLDVGVRLLVVAPTVIVALVPLDDLALRVVRRPVLPPPLHHAARRSEPRARAAHTGRAVM
eukprot:9494805-Pyramimonas_sp.AAC.1